ncbi:MAG: hypothetical protein EOR00_29860 [Mesorhizobium sp.]|uniref:HEAT repeat domain-containing protein n=1 Tax=Mesorhizobium sp. TaxID=1871066 RepID=UPI000FE5DDF5|nr:HEAT repeat domain-containing protein [Mesorhizobium sp.]RWP10897.1 MAG: hypothetical protein EOR00_29860 [Mesorhizobium sp.]
MLTTPEKAPPPRRIVNETVRQHAELAAFLWNQRDDWLAEDPPDMATVADIGERLDVNLDGLRIAGAAARPFLLAQYEDFSQKGEMFALSWMALELSDDERMSEAVEFARAAEDAPRGPTEGLVGALAWHKAAVIGPHVRKWLASKDTFCQYLAVRACIEHMVDPRDALLNLVRDPDVRTRAAALRLAGKLGRADLAREVLAGLDSEDEQVRTWAGWALTELGSGSLARDALKKIAATGGPDALIAMRTLVKAGPEKDVRAWMGGLMKSPATAPLAVRGIGMLGDRSVLPWLIERMREPQVAVAARGAFLELYPEAREETKLFANSPADMGPAFSEHFGDDRATLPNPDLVAAWIGKQA